ncbi:MAG: multicomponent Na+:H+ antiporter subunit [Thermoanaerobacteraceae bacterium]|jgi:multicomponent Na+:H+ antiporter subunit B|nr:multicomponent Na+:H+ antiporter subunit [Thermoanaerobacteraceae bacterium]
MKKFLTFFSIAGFMVFGLYASFNMTPFGSPVHGAGDDILKLFLTGTKALNGVTSIVFDFRGYDTFGEAIVLFTAVSGTVAVLRHMETNNMQLGRNDHPGVVVQTAVGIILPLSFVLGLYIILHGHLSPGGGFQGGVVLASGAALIFLGYGKKDVFRKFRKSTMSMFESLGALMFLAVASISILKGQPFFANVLDKKIPGELYSSGTIFWMDIAVGWKVFAGIAVVILLFVGLNGIDEKKEGLG